MTKKKEIPTIKRFTRGDRLLATKGDRHHVQAQQVWLILVACVMESDRDPKDPATMTYGELASKMGYTDSRAGHTLGRQLGIVGEFCKANNLPPLNAIVINQSTSMPGNEVVLRAGRTVKQEQGAVMREDWYQFRVPTTGTFRQVMEAL